jgi:hypothetical protein
MPLRLRSPAIQLLPPLPMCVLSRARVFSAALLLGRLTDTPITQTYTL